MVRNIPLISALAILLSAILVSAIPAFAAEPTIVPAPPVVAPDARPPTQAELVDGLLGRLRLAENPEQAKIIEHGVWELWSRSGSASADILVEQAMKAANAGQGLKAIAILNTVIDSKPGFVEAWNKRATVYFMIGDYDRSLADIEKVLSLEPRHFGALAGQGLIYNEQGNPEAAIRSLRRALAINPHLDAAKKALDEIEPDFERAI